MPTSYRKLRVFLCHASQDKPVIRELYEKLLAEDWIDPWLDEEKLLPGQDWDLEIEKAVEVTDAVIVCLSNNSVNKEGYVQKELRFVLDIADEKAEESIFAIPVRLDECLRPRRLKKWQYVDYFPSERKEWAIKRLMQALQNRANQIVERDKQDLSKIDPLKPPQLQNLESRKTVNVLELAGTEKRKQEFVEEKNRATFRCYLWGPAGTGKTWLLDAFIRKLNLIEQALRDTDQPFDVWMEDTLGARLTRYVLSANSTSDLEYIDFMLRRRYFSRNSKDVMQLAGTHDHELLMLDGPGNEITGSLAIEANTEDNRAKVTASNIAIKNSDYLIVCVERGRSPFPHKPGNADNNGESYLDALRRLLAIDRKPDQQVVICMTKADRYGGKVMGFDGSLSRLFGRYASEISDCLRGLSGTGNNIPSYFWVSAVGYYRDQTGKVKPNINLTTNSLIQPENWNPDNVEKPFFKVLTDAELHALENITINPPNFLPKIIGNFLTKKYRKELISNYISYDDIMSRIRLRI